MGEMDVRMTSMTTSDLFSWRSSFYASSYSPTEAGRDLPKLEEQLDSVLHVLQLPPVNSQQQANQDSFAAATAALSQLLGRQLL